MPPFEIEVLETVTRIRKVIVVKATADEANADAAKGFGTLTGSSVHKIEHESLTITPYNGPRYVVERIEDDPDYADVIDMTTGDPVECGIAYDAAQDEAENLNTHGPGQA